MNKSLNILKEREAVAASYMAAANNAFAASADAIAMSSSNKSFTSSPPQNGGLKQVGIRYSTGLG